LRARQLKGDIQTAVKRISFLICLAWITLYTAEGADRRIAFERDGTISISNLEGSVVRQLSDGVFPAISSDGKFVAFTMVENATGQYIRRLAIVEIGSATRRIFTEIPSDNSYHADWSPDGNWILFTLRSDGVWSFGIVKADGTNFRFIRKGDQEKVAFYSPCWAADGNSVFCQDMTNIYRIALDGSIQSQWQIRKIMPNGGMTGDARIDVSPDGHRLLLSADMDEEYERKDWDGPVPALWSFDLSTGAAVRLTSKNLFAWDGCWLDDANILFVSQRPGDKQAALYRTNGKNLKRLIEDAHRPSVSKP
jgi:TolB protein